MGCAGYYSTRMTVEPVALDGLSTALEAALGRAASAAPDAATAAGLGGFADVVRAVHVGPLDPAGPPPVAGPVPARLPVCAFWDTALDRGESGQAAAYVPALRSLGPSLRWTQNLNYRRRPPDPMFLERYGYAVLVGPPGDPPPLVTDPRLALGVRRTCGTRPGPTPCRSWPSTSGGATSPPTRGSRLDAPSGSASTRRRGRAGEGDP